MFKVNDAVNFEHISHLTLVFLFLPLNMYLPAGFSSIKLPSLVPSSPMIILMEEIICCITGGAMVAEYAEL